MGTLRRWLGQLYTQFCVEVFFIPYLALDDSMAPIILRDNPTPDDDRWGFNVRIPLMRSRSGAVLGKHISFSPQHINFDVIQFPANRILQSDDPSKFVLCSFELLRFPEKPASVAREYMLRFFQSGLFLNGVQYRFYGHSNSQLRSRSCFLREAQNDDELDDRIYSFGDFKKIMNAGKRAKRIGLMFSEARLDWVLEPKWTKDIEDISSGGEVFSDGCGLISRKFAVALSKHKRIIFRGKPYTPCVFQIRYRGYKGVLMIHPDVELAPEYVHFRKSQKKFTATQNNTFSVVDHSIPYVFARLNNDIVVLLSSLSISTEIFREKQRQYHELLMDAGTDWVTAYNLLVSNGRLETAEKVLLDGLESDAVQQEIRNLQQRELSAFKKNDRNRVRMLLPKSRFLFGVCDPYGVLEEGEVHVRLSMPRQGATTLTNVDVLVVRNPCLHPGDCLKLRAVNHGKLSQLVDCLVFSSKGRRAAPSMSSGGDLDGDRFTVIWDPDLVPKHVSGSYTYPPMKENISNKITRQDLAKHFASYNSMMLGRITALHSKWLRYSPKGALCEECQELNALHSSVVDGGSIRIPDRLLSPPVPDKDAPPFVLTVLHDDAAQFVHELQMKNLDLVAGHSLPLGDAEDTIRRLLTMEETIQTEYELVQTAMGIARRHNLDFVRYLPHVNFDALTTAEKHAMIFALGLHLRHPQEYSFIWNSLVRSEILRPRDLEDRKLGGPIRLQRLYTSTIQGRAAFFEYLKDAIADYNRRLILIKTDDRFAIGIFLRGKLAWDDEPDVNDNVMVCSFMSQSSTSNHTYRRGTPGYKLYSGENLFQLFDKQRANSFIFMTRPPAKSGVDIITSIALQKISGHVRQQCGRVWRTPVVNLEIHVVSNRDREAHRVFDLRFEHVQTEEYIPRFDYRPRRYIPNSLREVNWGEGPSPLRDLFLKSYEVATPLLQAASDDQLDAFMRFAIRHRSEDRIFWIFDTVISKPEVSLELAEKFLDGYPDLAFSVLKRFLPENSSHLPESLMGLAVCVLRNIIRSANHLGLAPLVGLEKLDGTINNVHLSQYFELLWLAALSVRSSKQAQEVIFVLHEARSEAKSRSRTQEYAHKHALAIAFDRAEEAGDTCPCNESGRPRRTPRSKPTRARLAPLKDRKAKPKDLPESGSSGLQATAPQEPEQQRAKEDEKDLPSQVMANIRVDAPTPIRIHSHVRLQVSSPPEHSTLPPAVLDAVVLRASRGELVLDLLHSLPPEYAEVDWNLFDAGSVATSKAMLDAIQRLAMEGTECCKFHDIITGSVDAIEQREEGDNLGGEDSVELPDTLNASQRRAILLARPGRLTLIQGPPGTGKTTVVVQILLKFIRNNPESRILMTASTHNAVDNVLERFVTANDNEHLLTDEQILRAATESSRVNKALQKYTIDARLGGSLNDDPRLIQKAEKRVKDARIVFTTCTGAGLGIIRRSDFEVVLIDEASQITEPGVLIPLVKGCNTAVLVGDHEQLRPTVRPMGKALELDKSMFERLYTGPHYPDMSRTMIDTQYRFSEEIAKFPSNEFYEGKLRTGRSRGAEISNLLAPGSFPWPFEDGKLVPVVFVQCASEEDFGRSSKSNVGQVNLAVHILSLLRTPRNEQGENNAVSEEDLGNFSVAILTPYSRQVKALKDAMPSAKNINVSTIDGFQGREGDVVIFSTVRCNAEGDIGFVEDAKRLNVAWTRPRLALVILGDRRTLSTNDLWRRALQHCKEVVISTPEEGA